METTTVTLENAKPIMFTLVNIDNATTEPERDFTISEEGDVVLHSLYLNQREEPVLQSVTEDGLFPTTSKLSLAKNCGKTLTLLLTGHTEIVSRE